MQTSRIVHAVVDHGHRHKHLRQSRNNEQRVSVSRKKPSSQTRCTFRSPVLEKCHIILLCADAVSHERILLTRVYIFGASMAVHIVYRLCSRSSSMFLQHSSKNSAFASTIVPSSFARRLGMLLLAKTSRYEADEPSISVAPALEAPFVALPYMLSMFIGYEACGCMPRMDSAGTGDGMLSIINTWPLLSTWLGDGAVMDNRPADSLHGDTRWRGTPPE